VKLCALIAAVLPILAAQAAAQTRQNYLDDVDYGMVLFTVSAPPVRGATPDILAGVKDTLVQRYQRSFMEQLKFQPRDVPVLELVRIAAEEKCGFVLEATVVAHNEERRESRIRQRMMMLGRNGWTQLFQDLSDVPLMPNVAIGTNPAEVPFLKTMLPMKATVTQTGEEGVTVGIQVQNNLPFDVKSFNLAAEPVAVNITVRRDPERPRNDGTERRLETTTETENFLVSFGSRVSLDIPSGKPAATTLDIRAGDATDRLRVRRQVSTVVIYGVVGEGKFPDGKAEE